MANNYLLESLDKGGVASAGEVLTKLERFAELLEHWQGKVNLTTITGHDRIMTLHFADCARLLPFLPMGSRIIDLGSGAGLPGLFLGCCRPDLRVTSVEKVGKKIIFQRTVCRELGLEQVIPVQGDIMSIAGRPEFSASFDLVVTRAWTSIEAAVSAGIPFLCAGGSILSMTSDESGGVDAPKERFGVSGGVIDRYSLPYANKEHLIWKYTLSGENAVQ